MFSRIFAAAALILALTLPAGARADLGPDLTLAAMARRAGVAFAGVVERVEPARIGSVPATRITFRVSEALRGVAGDTVVLTMLGGERPGRLPYRVIGLPVFATGQEWVLLTYPASAIGLSAPVGLYRGAFRVVERDGLRQVLKSGPVAPGEVAAESYGSFMSRLRPLLDGAAAGRPSVEAAGGDADADLQAVSGATGRGQRP